MSLTFKNTDEINAFLLKDTTPHDYCISIVKAIIAHVREYVDGERTDPDDFFNDIFFFADRQCSIYLKNHTLISWDIETTLESVVLPNPDDIEYVSFYHCFPMIATQEQAEKLGITKQSIAKSKQFLFFNLWRKMDINDERDSNYQFDSIHGAFILDNKTQSSWHPDSS